MNDDDNDDAKVIDQFIEQEILKSHIRSQFN